MRKTLEDLYYGNITPHAQDMTAGSELKQAVGRVAHYENQLTEQLNEAGQTILTKLIRSQHEIDSITARKTSSWASGWASESWPNAWMTTTAT